MSSEPLRVAVIGAGVRGTGLSRKISSLNFPAVIVAVAEPDKEKRENFALEFKLPDNAVFNSWDDLISQPDICDAAIIATLDNQHAGPAIACLECGWHILIEKPLADSFEDCLRIDEAQKKSKKVVAVCHTLRFMDGFLNIRQILDSAIIGPLIHIDHFETGEELGG